MCSIAVWLLYMGVVPIDTTSHRSTALSRSIEHEKSLFARSSSIFKHRVSRRGTGDKRLGTSHPESYDCQTLSGYVLRIQRTYEASERSWKRVTTKLQEW